MALRSDSSFARRTLIVLLLAALFVTAGVVFGLASQVLLTLFAGILLGIFLRGTGQWLASRSGLSYLASLAVVCTTIVLAGLAFTTFLAASVTQQFSEMFDQLPQAVEQLRTRIAANPLGQRILESTTAAADESSSQGMTYVVSAVAVVFAALGNGVLILFVGLFLAADPDVYLRGLIRLVPQAHRDRATEVLAEAGDVLLRWLLGRLLLMTVIGTLTWVGLMLMGVPLALALGVLAGALSFIPNIGPVISAIPAMLLAASAQPIMAVYVAALYLALQTAESYLLEPYIVRKTADLPAAMVIGFQLLMGTLLGILGLALATPILAMLSVFVERLYIEDVLGDRNEAEAGA